MDQFADQWYQEWHHNCIDHLKSHGAKTIVCAAVHGQFVGNAIEKLSGSVIVCTDSLESDYSVVSINGLISGFIKNSQ